jgi:hypothetical protein
VLAQAAAHLDFLCYCLRYHAFFDALAVIRAFDPGADYCKKNLFGVVFDHALRLTVLIRCVLLSAVMEQKNAVRNGGLGWQIPSYAGESG